MVMFSKGKVAMLFGQSTILLAIEGAAGALIILVALAVARVWSVHHRLRRLSRPGRQASLAQMASGEPLTTFNRAGLPGDPLNLEVTGTDGQLAASFGAAGWYRADEIDLVTAIRISVDSVFGRKYSTAPVSNLYLFGRKEDYAFERPGKNVRQRDHVRFWKTQRAGTDGRPIWIGSATKDVKVELSRTNHLPTHGISPDLDAERALLVSELMRTGYIIAHAFRPGFGRETQGKNGGGDPYFTDGMIALLALANVWTHPLVTQVRGAFGGILASGVERGLRWRLPREGRERADRAIAEARKAANQETMR